MLPFTKILCPIDFSEFSLEALDKASELATHFGAELFVLHVTQPLQIVYSIAPFEGGSSWDITEYEKAMREAAERKLEEIVESQRFGDVEMRPLIRDGNAADGIIEATEAAKADLIVISTHGLGGWRHLVFGSVAEKVIRLASRPILVTHVTKPLV